MKRLSALAMAAALTTNVSVSAFAMTNNASPWAQENMQKAYELGFATDSMMLNAKEQITKVGFIQMLLHFYETTTGQSATTEGTSDDILSAYMLGILSEQEYKTFASTEPLTRAEMCVFMVRTLHVCGVDFEKVPTVAEENFSDLNGVSTEIASAIEQAYRVGMISGYKNGTFAPEQVLTVQEAVSSFFSMYEFYQVWTNEDAKQLQATVGNTKLSLGMTKSQVRSKLGEPNRVDISVYGLEQYVYNDIENYVVLTFEGEKVVQLFTPVSHFSYQQIKSGTSLADLPKGYTTNTDRSMVTYQDSKATANLILGYEDAVVGLLLQVSDFSQNHTASRTLSEQQLTAIQSQLLEVIAVKRSENNVAQLQEDILLDMGADAHSWDMVENYYFDYTNLSGETPFDRMANNGVEFHTATEVIIKEQGEVPQIYAQIMKLSSRYHNIMDAQMTKIGMGVANHDTMLNITMDLCS